ncbi:hypothetical protein [Novosphingobium aerophilum]|uniref:Uncharacterized protein n=1 Tax=Novosphingobium aerophilum TaxID=2839843 RepID=A0A7X1KAS9_9SPHN|nr:hypothetical protein [Novosphingobium aerophilum]MBC2650541.1 hypothetical protein [Novosphingobium aerophilum]
MTAYKRDLMTVDLLCLLLELDEGVLEVHEDMRGYPAFEQAMFEALGLDPEWKLGVLFPAFEARPTLIYQRTSI